MAVFRDMESDKDRDVELEAEIDLAFHRAVAQASHNPLLLRLMLSLRNLLREYILLSIRMTDDMRSTIEEHQSVFEAIRARDPDGAAQSMERHLSISRSLIVHAADRLKSSQSSEEGEP
jgi:GntR family transcriptional repressor for pyruvate dehydrogenase complex